MSITLSVNFGNGDNSATLGTLKKIIRGMEIVGAETAAAPAPAPPRAAPAPAAAAPAPAAAAPAKKAAEPVEQEAKRGRGRPPKKEAPKVEEPAADDFDLGDAEPEVDAGAEDDDGLGFDDEPAAAASSKLDLDKDIIPAFQAFAKKHSREKAKKLLEKYKVTSVRDLPVDKYAEVLSALQK